MSDLTTMKDWTPTEGYFWCETASRSHMVVRECKRIDGAYYLGQTFTTRVTQIKRQYPTSLISTNPITPPTPPITESVTNPTLTS